MASTLRNQYKLKRLRFGIPDDGSSQNGVFKS